VEEAFADIWPRLGRQSPFYRRLVDLTANVKAALLLSQAIDSTRRAGDLARGGGWWVKTSAQWTRETGLSPKEQATARNLLRALALLEERRLGMPARLSYRLALDRLGRMLAARGGSTPHDLDVTDAAVLGELLGPAFGFYRTLAAIGGGVHAGLLLSRALQLTRLQADAGWVGNSAARWTAEIGLTRREQEAARRDLARSGVWEEARTGAPPRRMARIRLDALGRLLAGGTAPNGDPGMAQSERPVTPKAPAQLRRNRHHSAAESAILYIRSGGGVYIEPPPPTAPFVHSGPVATGGGGLIFPDQLVADERVAAQLLLRPCADQAQALLDELAGRLQVRSVRSSPLGYLRGLIERATAGTFVPELGPRIAAGRRRREEEAARERQRAAEAQRLAAERARPEHQATVAARCQEIRRLLGARKPGPDTGTPS
jgi:hypothetical protein